MISYGIGIAKNRKQDKDLLYHENKLREKNMAKEKHKKSKTVLLGERDEEGKLKVPHTN